MITIEIRRQADLAGGGSVQVTDTSDPLDIPVEGVPDFMSDYPMTDFVSIPPRAGALAAWSARDVNGNLATITVMEPKR